MQEAPVAMMIVKRRSPSVDDHHGIHSLGEQCVAVAVEGVRKHVAPFCRA